MWFFKGKKEISQEDPISPLLFVIVMDYFSRLMKKLSRKPEFYFHYRCSSLQLSYLVDNPPLASSHNVAERG